MSGRETVDRNINSAPILLPPEMEEEHSDALLSQRAYTERSTTAQVEVETRLPNNDFVGGQEDTQ
jgi:hypothetical protein